MVFNRCMERHSHFPLAESGIAGILMRLLFHTGHIPRPCAAGDHPFLYRDPTDRRRSLGAEAQGPLCPSEKGPGSTEQGHRWMAPGTGAICFISVGAIRMVHQTCHWASATNRESRRCQDQQGAEPKVPEPLRPV